VPPVGDLDGLRSAAGGAVGTGPGTVAADDLDAGMVVQPGGQGVGGTVAQQRGRLVAMSIRTVP
jgi:hypothetical protein